MTRAAHALIPHDTLLDVGRVSRLPLRLWVSDLFSKLDRIDETRPESWIDIAGCMNNAALIEVFRGSRERAWELCDLQLRWVANLAKVHGMAAVGDLAPQPWVNIGRLLRIARDQDGALRHFALLPDTRAGKDMHFGPVAIDAATWQEIVETKSMDSFLEAVYIVDSTRCYFGARDYAGALAFIERARAMSTEGMVAMLDEAEVIALAGLERYGEAMEVTKRESWARDRYCKLVRSTYQAAILAEAGQSEPAERLLAQIAERVLPANLENHQDQRVLRYLFQLGVVAEHLDMDALAERIWQKGLDTERGFRDVPLQLTFLDALLALDRVAEREALEQQRADLLDESLYTVLRRAHGLAADPEAAADPCFDLLRQRLEATAEAPLAALPRSGGQPGLQLSAVTQ